MNRHLGNKVAVSWSGGKDCGLALHRVLEANKNVVCLISMVSEKDQRNHAHGIRLEILKAQAKAIGLPLVLVDSAGEYENSMIDALTRQKEQQGIDEIVFGSLYSKEDRKWNEEVAFKAGLKAVFPVWIPQKDSLPLLEEFISLGFTATICRASEKHLDQTWTGRMLDRSFFKEIQQKNVCVMGENGEYHTFLLDGPVFRKRVELGQTSVVLNSGLWSLDVKDCRLVEKEANT